MRILLSFLLGTMVAAPQSERTWIAKVDYHQSTYDFSGIEFFELRYGPATAFTLSIPQQSEIAMFLRENDKKRIIVSFTPTGDLEAIKR